MNPDLDLFEEPELGIDLTPLIDVIFIDRKSVV